MIGDLSHYEIYRKAFRKRTTVINWLNKDLQSESKNIITFANPLFLGRAFWGVTFWEIDRERFFENLVLPTSFEKQKYPFVQVIYPESPISGLDGTALFEHNKIDKNLEKINEDPRY